MVELTAPPQIVVGQPFTVSFRSEERVAGRLRLTAGTEALGFELRREGRDPVTSAGHRLRGREATVEIANWGEHESGTELVLRFEGAKVWIKVS